MKRETPRFSPSALKPAPPVNLRLCFPDCRPPRPAAGQSDGRTDGRMDGQTAQAPPGSAQGRRQGGQEGIWGSALGAPCPQPGQGPPWPPRGRLFGDSFLFLVPPRPLARRGGCSCWTDTDGCWEALAPTRLWQRHQRGSETPPSPATAPPALRPPPIPAAGAESRGEEGAASGGDPAPAAPASPPAPASAVAPAPRSLSPPSQKQRDSLSFIFYLINFHFLHKTSNCKYF